MVQCRQGICCCSLPRPTQPAKSRLIGPIWSIPMDIAPQYAGTGSGLMNTGSAVAAIVSPLAFGLIVDLTGSWVLPFAVSIALLLLGCAMAFTMHPERRFAEKTPGTTTVGAE